MTEILSFPEKEIVDPSLPVSSLYLLVPPLQLFSAAMWQVLQQKHMLHYWKLEEFVSLVMAMFPELLSESQWTELTLGLQHMNPAQIGCETDPALEVLLWEFLSRLNRLLLVPDLKQTVSWLCAAPSVLEICVQSFSYIDQLRTLLSSHRSCQRLDKNEAPPSLEECRLSDMGLPPSQRVVDSAKLTKTNSQSQTITECMNCLNPTSGEVVKAESVMDSSDCTGEESQSSLNRCENVEERTQRKTENLMSRKEKITQTNIKEEEEDGEIQILDNEREDDESYEEGYWKEQEKQMDKQMEGNATGQTAQTDELVQNRFSSDNGQQEGEELFTLVNSCLLKQPRVLIRKLEIGSRSVNVSSPPYFMVTPLRANGSLSLKTDQSLTQKRKTVDQFERPLKLLPSSSEIRMCPEVSLSSSVVSCRDQNTGRAVEELSQSFACSQCPFVHPEEVNLHQHIEKVHTEELNTTLGSQPLPCSSTHACPSPTKTLPIPTPSHTGSPAAHTCSQCGKSFKSLSYFKLHVQTHTGEWPYHCSQCGKRYLQLCNLKVHQQIHTGDRPYPCSKCGKSFSQLCVLKLHQRTHTGERPYPCSQCGKSFKTLSHLKGHLQTHAVEWAYPCSQCGKSFRTLKYLKVHMRTHAVEGLYPCSLCGKRFTRWSHLKEHLQTHTGKRAYLCSQCGKSFRTLSYFKVHVRTHTGEWPYHCSQCGKRYLQLCNLKVHQQIHTGDRPYPCSQCGKSFSQLCVLKLHQRTHTGERPYPCSQCGKSFMRSNHLKEHLQTHAGERAYLCSQCGKSFRMLRYLKVHMLTHASDRAYHCSFCEKSFSRLSNLKIHQQTHTE